ncbi:MAG: GatB/YqeY domain-containing protein [Muribaculaceae bacterium]|nr:GatB/YqeY domain-containing protein [Muribaculaceae bacterium]
MSLFETISEAIKPAMLAKDKVRLQALRGIKKEFIEAKTAPGADGELSDDTAMKILVKMAKQRSESASIYRSQNRPDLAETEEAELAVIQEYLPKALSAEELDAELRKIIAQTGATGPADMGKVMGVATKALAGRADGKTVSAAVRSILASL